MAGSCTITPVAVCCKPSSSDEDESEYGSGEYSDSGKGEYGSGDGGDGYGPGKDSGDGGYGGKGKDSGDAYYGEKARRSAMLRIDRATNRESINHQCFGSNSGMHDRTTA
jgi:hypothetical protein